MRLYIYFFAFSLFLIPKMKIMDQVIVDGSSIGLADSALICYSSYGKTLSDVKARLPHIVDKDSLRVVEWGPNRALVCVVSSLNNNGSVHHNLSATIKRNIAICIRGTVEVANWIQNLNISLQDQKSMFSRNPSAPPGWSPALFGKCRVHSGFHQALNGLQKCGLHDIVMQLRLANKDLLQRPLIIAGE